MSIGHLVVNEDATFASSCYCHFSYFRLEAFLDSLHFCSIAYLYLNKKFFLETEEQISFFVKKYLFFTYDEEF